MSEIKAVSLCLLLKIYQEIEEKSMSQLASLQENDKVLRKMEISAWTHPLFMKKMHLFMRNSHLKLLFPP
jgi:hypothetical protein